MVIGTILNNTGLHDLITIVFKNTIPIPFYKYFKVITFLDITVMISFNVCSI